MAFIAGTLVLLGVLVVIQFLRAPPVIGAEEARELIARDSTVVLVDVRTAEEYRGPLGRLSGALHIPVDSLELALDRLAPLKGRRMVIYCRSGRRSMNATAFLRRRGYDAVNLEGGILRWRELNFPVVIEGREP
jgi:phage shock protein E